jgi:Tfp pilus assembly protein PilX
MKTAINVSPRTEQGSVLIVALMLLLVLTLLGVTAMNNMTMEERMASGFQKMQQSVEGGMSAINTSIANHVDANNPNLAVKPEDPLSVPAGKCGQADVIDRGEINADEGAVNGGTTVAKMKVTYRGYSKGLRLMPGCDSDCIAMKYDIHADTAVKVGGITAAQSYQVQTVTVTRVGEGDGCEYNKDELSKLNL